MKKIIKKLLDSYLFIISLSLVAGLFLFRQVEFLASYSTIFLGIIFFFSALKINLKEIKDALQDKLILLLGIIFILIITPIFAYYFSLLIAPEIAISMLILFATPAGMATPFLCEICKGKYNLSLVLCVVTSLLAPISIPLLIKFILGTEIEVEFINIFLSLIKIILIPFVLANVIKYFFKKEKIVKIFPATKPISTILIGLIVMGLIAKNAEATKIALQEKSVEYLIPLFIIFGLIHITSYFLFFWKNKQERIALSISFTYMNITLAIYLAGNFFNTPEIIIPIILAELPWSLLLVPFKWLVNKKPRTT